MISEYVLHATLKCVACHKWHACRHLRKPGLHHVHGGSTCLCDMGSQIHKMFSMNPSKSCKSKLLFDCHLIHSLLPIIHDSLFWYRNQTSPLNWSIDMNTSSSNFFQYVISLDNILAFHSNETVHPALRFNGGQNFTINNQELGNSSLLWTKHAASHTKRLELLEKVMPHLCIGTSSPELHSDSSYSSCNLS